MDITNTDDFEMTDMSPIRPARRNELDLTRFGVVAVMQNEKLSVSERRRAVMDAASFAAANDDARVSHALLAEIEHVAKETPCAEFKGIAQSWLEQGRVWVGSKHGSAVAHSAIRYMPQPI